ncbi:hypothetical protein AAHE18_01G132200 [Arachis hypogaea]
MRELRQNRDGRLGFNGGAGAGGGWRRLGIEREKMKCRENYRGQGRRRRCKQTLDEGARVARRGGKKRGKGCGGWGGRRWLEVGGRWFETEEAMKGDRGEGEELSCEGALGFSPKGGVRQKLRVKGELWRGQWWSEK